MIQFHLVYIMIKVYQVYILPSTSKLHKSACCPHSFSTRNEDTETEYFTAEEYIDETN